VIVARSPAIAAAVAAAIGKNLHDCILNFSGEFFVVKVAPAKDLPQQNSAGARQKIPSLLRTSPLFTIHTKNGCCSPG
jgi:hypothetical protein